MASTNYSPTQQLPSSVSSPIQSQIAAIQAGINSLKGSSTAPQSGGAVNSSGQIVGEGGKILGAANPLDVPGNAPTTSTSNKIDTSQPQPNSPQAQVNANTPDNAQAPDALVKQVQQAQASVNNLAAGRGLTLQAQPDGTYKTAPNLSAQYTQAHQLLSQSGIPAPTSGGAGSAGVTQAMSNVAPSSQGNLQLVDSYYSTNQNVQGGVDQLMQILSPDNATQQIKSALDQITADKGELSSLRSEYMNNQNIINGTQEDIRNEITKAGGFATDSQVQVMAAARNKALIARNNQLSQLIQSQQDSISTDTTLLQNEKELANTQFNQRMSILNFYQQNQQYMMNAAKDTYKTLMDNNPEGLYSSLLNDPIQAQRFTSIMGVDLDSLKGMVSSQQLDNTYKSLQIDKLRQDISGSNLGNVTVPIETTEGITTNIPVDVAPYYNTSNSGVGYVDGSTLQGTAAEKKAIIDEATQSGIKVITNKNTVADLSNIKDANNKLDTISEIIGNISQPNALARALYGVGLTKFATLSQSNSQQAAAGALQSVGLDILKSISGVQGFRGNQTAVQQVTDHLPSIYDTQAVVQQKIDYIRQLISDREDGLLGVSGGPKNTSSKLLQPSDIPNGYYQASDGLLYRK